MKNLLYLCVAVLALSACSQPQKGYTISGKILSVTDGQAILLMSTGGRSEATPLDTVTIKEGTFTFNGKLKEPAYLSISIEPEGQEPARIGFYGENSTINVEADWKDVLDQYGFRNIQKRVITGSHNQTVSDSLRALIRSVFEKYGRDSAMLMGKSEIFNAIIENRTVESVGAVLESLSSSLTLDELAMLYDTLTPNVQASPFTAEVANDLRCMRQSAVGQPAYNFTLKQPDGTDFTLSSLKGQIVVLDFWASWCKPCRESFPKLKELYAKYHPKGVEFVGITNDNVPERWLKALEEDQLPWIQTIDTFSRKNYPADVITEYAAPFLPTLILIDREGVIAGRPADKHELQEMIENLLK